jgi:DNA-binding MarR family transcriptional regulator
MKDRRDNHHLEQLAWMFFAALRRVNRNLDVRSHELEREYGLTSPQLNVLWALANSDGISIGKVAEVVSLSNATLSAIADRLEEHGLITRARSASDKRQVLVTLSEAGRALLSRRPLPFNPSFMKRLEELEGWQRTELLASIQHVGAMMEPDMEDVAPPPAGIRGQKPR